LFNGRKEVSRTDDKNFKTIPMDAVPERRNTPTRKQWKRKTLLLEMGKAVSFSGYDIQIQ
jgi:hypothetical protein